MQIDESDEVIQAYIQQYRLDEKTLLPAHRKKALYLITDFREIKRMHYENRNQALKALANAERRLVELKVFHASEHEGYNALIGSLDATIRELPRRIDEKFPEAR